MSNVYVKNSNSAKGIGFTGLLTVAFIVLKLCDVIKWSWVWVLSPLWIGFLLWLLVFVIICGVYVWAKN